MGSAIDYLPELHIGAGDAASPFLSTYQGKIKELKDGDVIDLGGRMLDVVATPAHPPGSTTFIDKAAGYGFSGDSFGSGNLLLRRHLPFTICHFPCAIPAGTFQRPVKAAMCQSVPTTPPAAAGDSDSRERTLETAGTSPRGRARARSGSVE